MAGYTFDGRYYVGGGGVWTMGDPNVGAGYPPAATEADIFAGWGTASPTSSAWVMIDGTVAQVTDAFIVAPAPGAPSGGARQNHLFPTLPGGNMIYATILFPGGSPETWAQILNDNPSSSHTIRMALVLDLGLGGDTLSFVDDGAGVEYDTAHTFATVPDLGVAPPSSFGPTQWIMSGPGTADDILCSIRVETQNCDGNLHLIDASSIGSDPFAAIDALSPGASLGADSVLVAHFGPKTLAYGAGCVGVLQFSPDVETGEDWVVGRVPIG